MGVTKYFERTPSTSPMPSDQPSARLLWPVFASSLVLSALSIANLGLLGSSVAWMLDQKHNVHSYRIAWPGAPFDLNVQPAHFWTDHAHESSGVAGYGILVGLFGMITAWRMKSNARPLKSMAVLLVLQVLAVLFTLSAIIFVFLVTYQTTGQIIRAPVAANTMGKNYGEFKWTPETWYQAVLDLPLANQGQRSAIESRVSVMVAWRWMLLPIFIADIIVSGVTMLAWLKQRNGTTTRVNSANSIEK